MGQYDTSFIKMKLHRYEYTFKSMCHSNKETAD